MTMARTSNTRKWIWIGPLALLVALAGGAGLAWMRYNYPVHHFAVVAEGVLYRSGQPPTGRWEDVQRRCRLKTVISVREIKPDAPWYIEEERFCREQNIKLIRTPLLEKNFDDAMLYEFVAQVIDPNNQPVLVHCEAGSRRTGVAVAAYRVLVDGWDVDRAVAEAATLRFVPEQNPISIAALRRLAAASGAASRPAPAGK